ncbi:MAG: energy-coupled thiamine transporter ThiT [Firmicutes bacterium]|nr:energy-coupled thiamine transporter ThiT [Bacillota bacterium]
MFDFRRRDGLFRNFSVEALSFLIVMAVCAVGLAVAFLALKKHKKAQLAVGASMFIGFFVGLIGSLYYGLTYDGLLLLGAFAFLVLLGGAIVWYCYKSKKDLKPLIVHATAFLVALAGLSALFVALAFQLEEVSFGAESGNSGVGFIVGFLAPCITASVVTAFVLSNKGRTAVFTSRDLTYAAVMLSIAIALSYVKARFPMTGGGITLAASLPIMLYCYYFGLRKGAVIVSAFIAFQFLQGAWIVHPVQAILDYVVAYGALISFAIFNKRLNEKWFKTKFPILFFIAGLLYIAVRYTSHVVAGVVWFKDLVAEGWKLLPYSMVVNSYTIVDAAIALIAGLFLLCSNSFRKQLESAGGLSGQGLDGGLATSSDAEGVDAAVGVSADALQNADAAQKDD